MFNGSVLLIIVNIYGIDYIFLNTHKSNYIFDYTESLQHNVVQ